MDILEPTELFERATGKPYEGNEKLWNELMGVLKLPLCYVIGTQRVLQQGRWRNAKNPIGYVKSCAMRESLRAGIVPEDYAGKLPPKDAIWGDKVRLKDNVWIDKIVRALDDVGYEPTEEEATEDEPSEGDLDALADAAGLSLGARRILKLRADGYSRDRIVNELCSTKRQKDRAIADWKQISRKIPHLPAVLALIGDLGLDDVIAWDLRYLDRTEDGQAFLHPRPKVDRFTPPAKALKAALKREEQTSAVKRERPKKNKSFGKL